MRMLLVAAVLFALSCLAQADSSMRFVNNIPLPGVVGRIDHMAVDTSGNRLFIAALGNNSLEVVDLENERRTRSITGLMQPQGVAFIPGAARLVVSNGGNGMLSVFDANTLKLITQVDLHKDADNLRYDSDTKQLFVAYGAGAMGIFDAQITQIGVISLPGHPESFALDADYGRMFINIPGIGAVLAVDVDRRKIISTWRFSHVADNFPMALEEGGQLLFVGTRHPPRLVGIDIQTGKIVVTVPIDGDADDMYVDNRRGRIYISCGAGFLDVVERTSSGRYQLVDKIRTAIAARTSLFVPDMQRLFLAVPKRGPRGAEIRIYATQ